jgi:hypothetical protein
MKYKSLNDYHNRKQNAETVAAYIVGFAVVIGNFALVLHALGILVK